MSKGVNKVMTDEQQVLVPLELIKAVAHIGVDWGYGEYELEKHHIAKARHIVAVHEQGEENE